MTDRDQILATLRRQAHPASQPPPAWRSRRQFADLAERFCAALTANGGEAHRTASLPEALDLLGRLLAEWQAQRVVVNPEPPLDQVDFAARWPSLHWQVAGQTAGDLRAFCAAADVGLGSAEAVLAETGTVVIRSGARQSRLAVLLPPIHVVIAPTSRLTLDIFTWTSGLRGPLPASLTLVSGPSKSADIEQTMAVGVHGPKRLVVILADN